MPLQSQHYTTSQDIINSVNCIRHEMVNYKPNLTQVRSYTLIFFTSQNSVCCDSTIIDFWTKVNDCLWSLIYLYRAQKSNKNIFSDLDQEAVCCVKVLHLTHPSFYWTSSLCRLWHSLYYIYPLFIGAFILTGVTELRLLVINILIWTQTLIFS